MRTVIGVARWVGSRVGRTALWRVRPEPVARVRPLAAGRRPLLSDRSR